MVSNSGRRPSPQVNYKKEIKTIAKILAKAKVPRDWYGFEQEDDTVCIVPQNDGMHIFIPERGKRGKEKVVQRWSAAISYIAPRFEVKYAQRVEALAKKRMEKEIRNHIRGIDRDILKARIAAHAERTKSQA